MARTVTLDNILGKRKLSPLGKKQYMDLISKYFNCQENMAHFSLSPNSLGDGEPELTHKSGLMGYVFTRDGALFSESPSEMKIRYLKFSDRQIRMIFTDYENNISGFFWRKK